MFRASSLKTHNSYNRTAVYLLLAQIQSHGHSYCKGSWEIYSLAEQTRAHLKLRGCCYQKRGGDMAFRRRVAISDTGMLLHVLSLSNQDLKKQLLILRQIQVFWGLKPTQSRRKWCAEIFFKKIIQNYRTLEMLQKHMTLGSHCWGPCRALPGLEVEQLKPRQLQVKPVYACNSCISQQLVPANL